MKESNFKISDAIQQDIVFPDPKKMEEDYEKEKLEIAHKYNLISSDKLTKKDDKWYFGGIEVEAYNHLYDENDNSEQFKIIKLNTEEVKKKEEERKHPRAPLFQDFDHLK